MTREEAIKVVKSNWPEGRHQIKEALETLIPELAESDDERIRKHLITHFQKKTKGEWNGMPVKYILAWLEKQKDAETEIEKAYKNADKIQYKKGFEDGVASVKPAEGISQLAVQGKGVYKICPRCKGRMVRDDSKVYTSMPPQYGYKCPICGETEFDTVMYDSPKMEEQKPTEITPNQFDGITYGMKGYVSEKPAEWSEEDKDKVAQYLHDKDGGMLWSKATEITEDILGMIRPQPHWKPSEEQMKALKYVAYHLMPDEDYREEMFSLYNDLKKL